MSKFGELVREGNVLVDFHATWCQPCKILGPILQELAREWEGKVRIIKIDIDKNPAIAQKLAVQGVPTMIFYSNGEQKWRRSGALPKHVIKGELEGFLDC
ncbi:thioredoxin [Phaeocystidibacter luteus]|uniref:Thioredoxin n=1 Tax=Phaeocystidibacter luteus TaxID=911197 RepID=A0A6N6RKQ7_9FLAO|nr:thioredoxin [Phaeocystidibacter luteus]KAB2813740.1 thioredoxin [Phaeocystidibacter luteus]